MKGDSDEDPKATESLPPPVEPHPGAEIVVNAQTDGELTSRVPEEMPIDDPLLGFGGIGLGESAPKSGDDYEKVRRRRERKYLWISILVVVGTLTAFFFCRTRGPEERGGVFTAPTN
jgi:hypothetical protein